MDKPSSGEEIPEDANECCPGPKADSAGKLNACGGCPNQGVCATAARKGPDPDVIEMAERMATVKHKILVLSGKGGVGKSTLSAQLSFALAALDYQVGLLDIDLCGPSIPKMLGLEGQANFCSNSGHSPVYVDSNLGVISIGFLLDHPDQPIAIRGPRKTEQIKKFVRDVDWGELDFLVVDAPPGTSDEQISIVQFLQAASTGGGVDGAIVVTTPQQVSLADVRKGVNFCKKVGVPVLGVVENMSGLFQPMSDIRWFERRAGTEDVMGGGGGERDVTAWVLEHLRDRAPEVLSLTAHCQVFDTRGGGAEKMCSEMEVPFWGKVPLDPQLCKAAEEGKSCFAESSRCGASAPALKRIINKLLAHFTPSMPPPSTQENGGV